jgi:5-methylcytosine-specific restriction enzyme A
MGASAAKPCAAPSCGALVRGPRRFCSRHVNRASPSIAEGGRGTAHERGYDARWRAARAVYLDSHPLCVECQRHGRLTPARVVDHVVPHRGDQQLFWDESNWQALCDFTSPHDCHGKKTGGGR